MHWKMISNNTWYCEKGPAICGAFLLFNSQSVHFLTFIPNCSDLHPLAPEFSYDESTLLQQVAEGNEKAFRRLVEQYADLLGAHIYRVTHSREATEEIVQDIFLKIWMTRESLAQVRNFRTYLYVISRNQALNALRSILREKKHQSLYEQSLTAGETEDEVKEKEAQISYLDQAIAQLPPQQQKAWLLSRRERMKYADIAREMNVSTETVKKHIQLASLSIMKYLESHLGILLIGILLEKKF
jgi:RNA polymerase sigma-70 factor (family 1)